MTRGPLDIVLGLVLLAVALASGGDLVADLRHGVTAGHVLQEAAIVVLALGCLAWLVSSWRGQQRQIASLRSELDEARHLPPDAGPEVSEVRERLSQVIARQFDIWELTPSEKEVGLLLIKGLSTREIAGLRNTSEKTVRLQASAIYQKAGVKGRHAFSAWFIEDFL